MDKSSLSRVDVIRLTVWLFRQCSLTKQHKLPPLCFIKASVLSALIRPPKPSTCMCWLLNVSSIHVSEKHSKFASRYSVRNLALACSSTILLRSNRMFPRITPGRGGLVDRRRKRWRTPLVALSFVVGALSPYCRQTRIQVVDRRQTTPDVKRTVAAVTTTVRTRIAGFVRHCYGHSGHQTWYRTRFPAQSV